MFNCYYSELFELLNRLINTHTKVNFPFFYSYFVVVDAVDADADKNSKTLKFSINVNECLACGITYILFIHKYIERDIPYSIKINIVLKSFKVK